MITSSELIHLRKTHKILGENISRLHLNDEATLADLKKAKLLKEDSYNRLISIGQGILSDFGNFVKDNRALYNHGFMPHWYVYSITAINLREDKEAFAFSVESRYVGRYADGQVDREIILIPFIFMDNPTTYKNERGIYWTNKQIKYYIDKGVKLSKDLSDNDNIILKLRTRLRGYHDPA